MVVLELFAGTRSIGKAFEKNGHKVLSVEWDRKFENIDLYADIGTLTKEDIIEYLSLASKYLHICGRIVNIEILCFEQTL